MSTSTIKKLLEMINYLVYYRKSSDGEETLYLDPNIKLKNQDYYNIGSIEPSPDNNFNCILRR